MSTAAEIADGVWTYATRTTDGLAPAASNGTVLDDIAYAVWTETVRTLDGSPASFSITVAETLPTPSQAATAGTSMPVSIAEVLPVPTQTVTAEAIEIFTVSVAESLPAPSQAAVAEFTPGASTKPLGAGGPRGAWSYYPPIYAVRTRGNESAPAPVQAAKIEATARRIEPARPLRRMPRKPVSMATGMQAGLAPSQSARLKSHRAIRERDREESDILMLLSSI